MDGATKISTPEHGGRWIQDEKTLKTYLAMDFFEFFICYFILSHIISICPVFLILQRSY